VAFSKYIWTLRNAKKYWRLVNVKTKKLPRNVRRLAICVIRVGIEYKNLWQTFVDIIFPSLNFPSSILMGKSNQNKQCQQISSFCLISCFFFSFQRTHDRIDIYIFPNMKWYFLKFQIIMFETENEISQNQVFADIVCF
jgi:hypothetical protein